MTTVGPGGPKNPATWALSDPEVAQLCLDSAAQVGEAQLIISKFHSRAMSARKWTKFQSRAQSIPGYLYVADIIRRV